LRKSQLFILYHFALEIVLELALVLNESCILVNKSNYSTHAHNRLIQQIPTT